ncbi:cation:proton antiporter domain-containing protein [Roseicella aerolata]|uniref:Cation:proton antiporter n=1 Tax=Roseicella aerolata TaxID=2883479 RepID=A0A9X1IIY5_9PROT|nr:cation:proton antiporter [Roseicella aerolata]
MPEVQFVSGVIVALGLLLALARISGLPPSPVVFAGGIASVLLPVPLPALRTNPEIVLGLLLPPLLYAGVVALSLDLLRHALVRGVVAGLVLVIGVTLMVAAAAQVLLPGLDPVACLLIGVCAGIGDTRLPQETGQAQHLPRALTDAYAGQAVSARLLVVSLYLLAREAVGGPPPEVGAALQRIGTDLLGGGLLGAAVGLFAVEFRRRIGAASVEVAISAATPFLAAILAGAAGVSVAVTIVVAALTVVARAVDRRTGEAISSPEARLVSRHVWSEAELMLSAALYFLIGRALPEALGALGRYEPAQLVLAAAALLALVVGVQFLLALLAVAMPWTPRMPGADGRPAGALRIAAVAAWSPHRSAIALALALAVPAAAPDGRPFAERELVLALVALMVVLSGLVQGTTLPALLGWAQLGGAEEERRETELAQATAAAAQGRARRVADPEGAAAEGRRALARLRGRDAIGDAALQQADQAVASRAQAERAGE